MFTYLLSALVGAFLWLLVYEMVHLHGKKWQFWAIVATVVAMIFFVPTCLVLHMSCLSDPLVAAAGAGDTKRVEKLIDLGAWVNYTDTEKKQTPLIAAAKNDHPDIVRLLIQRGADVNMPGSQLSDPLETALQDAKDHPEIVAILTQDPMNFVHLRA